MSANEIVDPSVNTSEQRWQLFQLVGPILGVFLVIGVISLVTWQTYHTMRAGTTDLSHRLLQSQQRYIIEEASHYLSPATEISFMASNMLNSDDPKRNAVTFMTLGRSVLRGVPHVDSFFMADDQGHFWMSTRRDGQYEETTLQDEDGAPYYRHKLTDKDGRFISTDRLPAEGYDPRLRPWYTGAIRHENRPANNRLYWTDPYPYLSTHQFIVTASLAFRALDGHHVVFAISISLNQLSDFVNSLRVARTGQAVIVDLNSHVIAGHNMEGIGTPGFDASNVHLDPKEQPVFLRALNVFRVMGDGTGTVRARGQDYVTIASAMPLAKRSWVLLLNAPEKEFANFANVAQRQLIVFSTLIVGLTLILALGLIYQGARVASRQKALNNGEREKERDKVVLFRIANKTNLLDPRQEQPYLCEALAGRSAARRASVWRLLAGGDRLLCEDMYNREQNAHGSGMELTRGAHPGLFKYLLGGNEQEVDYTFEHPGKGSRKGIDDPQLQADFQSVQRVLMRRIGAHHLFFMPVMEAHRPVGAILLEDPAHLEEAGQVMLLVASVLAIRFGQAQKEEHGISSDASGGIGVLPSAGQEEAETKEQEGPLARSGGDGKASVPQNGVNESVPIMVLEFSEAYSADKQEAEKIFGLIGELAGKVQAIAQGRGLFSAQVAGNCFIFLGSSLQKAPDGAINLANAAIGIREACLGILSRENTRLMFRIGLDVGTILVTRLGKDQDDINLWGEGLAMAETLAHNAPDGGQIQVSERAYQALQNLFLFRLRGEFFLPDSGITNSYILAGRSEAAGSR